MNTGRIKPLPMPLSEEIQKKCKKHIIGLYTGVAMLVAFAKPTLDNYKQFNK